MRLPNSYKSNSLTVRRTLNILFYCFNLQNLDFQYNGKWVYLDEFLSLYPHLMGAPASSIKIRFFGGPPRHWGWFDGSLATLLTDKIMWAFASKDEKYIKAVYEYSTTSH